MYSYSLRPTLPLKNTFIKVKTKYPNIPNAVYVFFTLLYGFGLDFGIQKLLKQKIRCIAKLFQIFVILLIIVMLVATREKFCEYYLYFYLTSYFLHHVMLFRANYTVCDLIIDVHTLIDSTTIVVKNRVGRIIYLFIIITSVSKYPFCVLKYILNLDSCQNSLIPGYIKCIPIVIIDGIAIILILINYYVYIALKYIKKSKKEVDTKVLLVNFMQITDSWDKIKPLYTRMVSFLYEYDFLILFRLMLFDTISTITSIYSAFIFLINRC